MPELRKVPVDKIKVPEVRVGSILTDEQKNLMASTIREVGVIQDPVVRALPDGSYELIAGRARIAQMAAQGMTEVLVKVVEAEDKTALVMNIIENVARGSYDYISISQAIRRLRTLGSTDEELEKIFPWRRRWISLIEDLQDLPGDVVEGIKAGKITPSHVQEASKLPTSYEMHDGLKTAINLGWDTGTFKTFVQNRVEQIEAAKKAAQSQGIEPVIPQSNPQELITYGQCLLCGYKVPRKEIVTQLVCQGCVDLNKYITSQLGDPKKAMETVFEALKLYSGMREFQEVQEKAKVAVSSPG